MQQISQPPFHAGVAADNDICYFRVDPFCRDDF
jgi:hypothetical protein